MKNNNSTNVFFLELVFSIFTFIIISTICLQVFAKSHILNKVTVNSTYSMEIAQNEIEIFYNNTQNSYIYSDSTNKAYYDSSWNQLPSDENASFCSLAYYSHDKNFNFMSINISDLQSDNVLFSQSVKACIKEEGEN